MGECMYIWMCAKGFSIWRQCPKQTHTHSHTRTH